MHHSLQRWLVVPPLLAGNANAQRLGPRDIDALPASTPDAVVRYGQNPLQYGELRLPAGTGPLPVVIVMHGGCWTRGFATARNIAPRATALTAHGVATWNVEYRQQGDPGAGRPGTFLDWAAATDQLRGPASTYPLDLSRVVATGHSAGARAALWLAAREHLRATRPIRGGTPLPIQAAVAIDGPGDLAGLVGRDASVCGKPVIAPWMGARRRNSPHATGRPRRWRLPLGIPQVLVASFVLPPQDATDYAEVARGKGDKVDVVVLQGAGHFNMIAPRQSGLGACPGADPGGRKRHGTLNLDPGHPPPSSTGPHQAYHLRPAAPVVAPTSPQEALFGIHSTRPRRAARHHLAAGLHRCRHPGHVGLLRDPGRQRDRRDAGKSQQPPW